LSSLTCDVAKSGTDIAITPFGRRPNAAARARALGAERHARGTGLTGKGHGPRAYCKPAKGSRVKVSSRVLSVSALGRQVVTVALSAVILLAGNAAPAQAITRKEVLKRANSWIKKHVQYNQSSYYQGYRRDCSGFVSMAWKLKSSYTSSDIGSVAHKISWRKLKPGDAVRRPGHVEIFAGWKNKKNRQYWALEESMSGKPALRAVKKFKSGYTALVLRGIKDAPKPKPAKPIIAPAPAPSVPPTGSIDTTPSAPATGTAN